MIKKKSDIDFSNLIIYVLIIILGILISYSLINQYRIINKDITSVFSSIKHRRLDNLDKVLSVKYSSSNLSDLCDIKNSDIVYEYYDIYSNKVKYEALFFNNSNISINDTIESISEIPLLKIFSINSNSNSNIYNNMLDESCDVIHINYSPDIFSTFIYESEKYKFISSNTESTYNTAELYYSNIIIQLVDSSTYISDIKNIPGKSNGLLFCKGKVQPIFLENSVPYTKDNKQINITPEKTFWIICSDDNNIVYDDTYKN